jgi:hypothetical protein
MALELVYEGLLSGLKNVASVDITDATEIVPGRVCCLSSVAGEVVFDGLLCGSAILTPFGIVADYKEDVVASGKVSVYLNGMYKTDQVSGTPAKGDLLSFTATGLFITAGSGDFVVATCTEEAGDDGYIEISYNFAGVILV